MRRYDWRKGLDRRPKRGTPSFCIQEIRPRRRWVPVFAFFCGTGLLGAFLGLRAAHPPLPEPVTRPSFVISTPSFDPVRAVAFHGTDIAILDAGGILTTRSSPSLQALHSIMGLALGPTVRFSPRGRYIANTEFIYDRTTGQVIPIRGANGGIVRCVAFDPSETMVAVGCGNGYLDILRIADGSCLRSSKRGGGIECVAWSPGGYLIATQDATGDVRILNALRLDQVTFIEGPQGLAKEMAFDASSERVAILDAAGTLHVRGVDARYHYNMVNVVGFVCEPRSQNVVVGTRDGQVQVLNGSGVLERTLPSSGRVTALAVRADGTSIAVGNQAGQVALIPIIDLRSARR